MKKFFTVTLLSLGAIFITTACTPVPRSPVDDIVQPDSSIIKKQQEFDQAMIEKNSINK